MTPLGYVDGSVESDSRTFHLVLDPNAIVQLDELVVIDTKLPDGSIVKHYGIVTELLSRLEGAELPSDTARYADGRRPADLVRRAEVRALRTMPETFISPHAGSAAHCAEGYDRSVGLFEDQMAEKLAVGLDLTGQPVYADMRFVDGRSGGHISISGISGVATKTSYATFLLYQLLETEAGKELLGGMGKWSNTRAVVFNTKGEDLLHLDRDNSRFAEMPDAKKQWADLGVDDPGGFKSVSLYAPRREADGTSVIADVSTRGTTEVNAYGWTPEMFVRRQLLQYCFTAEDERTTQVGFAEQAASIALLRRLRRLQGDDTGAIVILEHPSNEETHNADTLSNREPDEAKGGDGTIIRNFADLIGLFEQVSKIDDDYIQKEWFGNVNLGTRNAFLRRLLKLRRRIGPLVSCGVHPVSLENHRVHVVDISRLHDDAQRFVVGAIVDDIWASKQGTGREPLRFIVLDELNKYAPASGYSPLKDLLVDIAERGRSLGVLLIGAQQAASAVAPALPRNASLKVAGRLDAGESDSYRFLSPGLRERATRFMPGTMVVSQPVVPEPLPIRFPFPAYATNPDEAAVSVDSVDNAADITRNAGASAGPELDL